ncbi:MAG: hypothetical protein KDC14_17670 [Planctomycetes bacterium]|nr:hypothetical protein [Planctomycetota bacterium]
MLKLFDLRPDERRPTLWAALCYFCVLFSWYLIRPLREALGIREGAEALPYLMIGTVLLAALTNPLIARVLDKRTRGDALQFAYRAVQVCLLLFWLGFQLLPEASHTWLGYAFYSTSSVVNLLIVSVFWSLGNECFSSESARRSFGPAAAGGSLGAICGSFTASLVPNGLDYSTQLLIPAALLLYGAILAGRRLLANAQTHEARARAQQAFHGSAWSGWRDLVHDRFALLIFGYMCFHAIAGTWAYFVQAEVVAASGEHVTKFAYIDLSTNTLTFFLQLLLVGRLVQRSGVAWTLSVLPLITIVGFLVLAGSQTYVTVLLFQTLRRAASYGFSKPTREMLFSVFSAEQKYKLKNLIDVAGYRVADVLGSSSRILLAALNTGASTLCFIAAGSGVAWLAYNQFLGRVFARRLAGKQAAAGAGGEA